MKKTIRMVGKVKGKVTAFIMMTMVMVIGVTGVAMAAEPGVDFSAVKSALTSGFNVAEIASIIALIIGSGVGFVVLWWGARKLVNSIITAFKTGKIKF